MQTSFPTFVARPATRQNLTPSNTTATQNSHSHNTLTTDKVYFSGHKELKEKIDKYERLLKAMSINTTPIKERALNTVNQEINACRVSGRKLTDQEKNAHSYMRRKAQADALKKAYEAATSDDDAPGEPELEINTTMPISSSPLRFGTFKPHEHSSQGITDGKTEQEWLKNIHTQTPKDNAALEMQNKMAAWFKKYNEKVEQKSVKDEFVSKEPPKRTLLAKLRNAFYQGRKKQK